VSATLDHDAPSARPAFRVERRFVEVHGVRRTLRLVRFQRGWLASVDTPEGPTLGADRSPYLAASRALEPLGIGLTDAIEVVGTVAD
jgi:hypothetical protein